MIGRKCIYIPYLGKNDHPADVTRVSVNEGKIVENVETLDCLFPKDKAEIDADADLFSERYGLFKYEEALPAGLDADTNQYVLEKFVYTNMTLGRIGKKVWETDGKRIVFY